MNIYFESNKENKAKNAVNNQKFNMVASWQNISNIIL
jgi:hypothetical protein